jgi:flagellar biosynthesis component FlhA
MKFVKGDAIAGIVITAVNILGGLAVGIVIRELDFQIALQKYTLLTLGDGLLSQIPALLNSLAAGLIVTRVTQDNDDSLAVEVLDQLGSIKPALILSGTVSLLLAVTGVATISFLLMSGIFLFFGFLPRKSDGSMLDSALEGFIPKIPPLLAIGIPTNSPLRSCDSVTVRLELSRMLKGLYDDYGLLLPPPELQIQDELKTDYSFIFRGIQSAEYSLPSDDAAAPHVGRALSEPKQQFIGLCHQLKNFITERRADCVDDLFTRRLLDHLEQTSPELVAHTVPGVVTVTKLTRILRSLIHERINIKSIDSIVQALSEAASDGVPERLYLDEVRIALKRVISDRYSKNSTITGYRIDPIIDFAFGDSHHAHQQIEPAVLLELEEVLANSTVDHDSQSEVILLTSRASRRALEEYLRMRGKRAFVVLSEAELTDNITWVEKGQIQLSQNTAESILERLAA